MGESTHEQHVYHDNGDKSNWFVFQVKPPRTTLRQMVAPCVFTGLFFFLGATTHDGIENVFVLRITTTKT